MHVIDRYGDTVPAGDVDWSVVHIYADGVARYSDEYAPDVMADDDQDIIISTPGWEAMTGITGQYGYSGAVMHESEQWSRAHEDELERLSEDGPVAYAIVTVASDDGDLAGWAVVYQVRA